MSIPVAALMAALFAAASVAPAAARDLAAVEASGVLRVGTPGDYRPYADLVAGDPLGADIELARAVAARLAVDLEVVPTSWPTLEADARAGRFDLAVGGISITAERRAFARFATPHAEDGKTALVPCSRLRDRDDLRELNRPGVRVIVNPGGTNERFARARLPRARLEIHSDNRGVFDALAAGAADAMITDAVEARLQAVLRPGVLCAAHPDRPFERHRKAVMIVGDGALHAAVDRAVRASLRRGEPDAMRERWLAWPWPEGQRAAELPQARLLRLVDARLSMMGAVARYKWNARAPIEDRAREDELLGRLLAEARSRGLEEAFTRRFFEAQFAAARRLQEDLFSLWRSQGRDPSRDLLPPSADLRTQIRPRLDRLSAELIDALAALRGEGGISEPRPDSALTTHALSPEAARLALEPFAASQ